MTDYLRQWSLTMERKHHLGELIYHYRVQIALMQSAADGDRRVAMVALGAACVFAFAAGRWS